MSVFYCRCGARLEGARARLYHRCERMCPHGFGSDVECAACTGVTLPDGGSNSEGRVSETPTAPPLHRWPDGQVREEEPYRCGCFVAATGEQCTKLSDHDGKHVFASDGVPENGNG